MSDRRWYELPPGVRFRHHLDLAIARLEKAAQVAGQDEALGHPTERPERRCEIEEVAHDGAASTVFREVVLVIQSGERAPNHRVSEESGPLVGGDPAREGLPHAEVPRPPCDLVAERQ